MVRLLPASFLRLRRKAGKVSIPQWCDCCKRKMVRSVTIKLRFNPTMVRLLQKSRNFVHPFRQRSFNPTMVRLLLGSVKASMVAIDEFQSHNGAIAAPTPVVKSHQTRHVSIPQWCDCCPVLEKVNMIRLFVSIPQWCDCCYLEDPEQFKTTLVSIPQWCDCCQISSLVHEIVKKFQSHNGAIAAVLCVLF